MAWIQIRLSTTEEHAEAISDVMIASGALSVTFLDTHDTPVLEPLPGETPLWPDTTVMALYDANIDTKAVTQWLSEQPLFTGITLKVEALEDKDWEREWMDNFHPMQFGKRLWICPSWRTVPDENAVNVMLDPGLAFGTGTHPTTALCLEWLDSMDLTDQNVIDFGCGSGILAIAALKLGAKHVTGIDIDPQALEASLENAKRNQVETKLEVFLPEEQPKNLKADTLVANILAGPLRELAPLISDLVRPGGKLALSGLLGEQADELHAHYSQWFEMDDPCHKEDWTRLTGVRK
ncbi:50S ribosomal protein L11 methyltransferase [Paraferrimonas sp. SM1919]|uniref:50S ribosomal protein L11 methyltransferase n=1 Tax=Paraferrimonas sp. SM1919 TaxID=2662263 RepID=UPI0013D1900B|nr:50S ribosomal protein L11 methyltransferase [Paraferrimonas sp. SM1919]